MAPSSGHGAGVATDARRALPGLTLSSPGPAAGPGAGLRCLDLPPRRPIGGAASLVSGEPLSCAAVKAAVLGEVLVSKLDEPSREGGAAVVASANDLVCLHIVTLPP